MNSLKKIFLLLLMPTTILSPPKKVVFVDERPKDQDSLPPTSFIGPLLFHTPGEPPRTFTQLCKRDCANCLRPIRNGCATCSALWFSLTTYTQYQEKNPCEVAAGYGLGTTCLYCAYKLHKRINALDPPYIHEKVE